MYRTLFAVALLSFLPMLIGCAICGSHDDDSYSAYGGRWQRGDTVQGRVGSVFAPAGLEVTPKALGASDLTPADGDGEVATEPSSETFLRWPG